MDRSPINQILGMHNTVPTVGMGATILFWYDHTPGTVIWVSTSGKTCKVQEDRITVDPETRKQVFTPDPDGPVRTFRFGKRGWGQVKNRAIGLRLGDRQSYYDPHFWPNSGRVSQ